MSTELPPEQPVCKQDARICIVAATYNEKFMTPLLDNCLEELEKSLPYGQIDIVRVPGSFEVPVMVERVLQLREDAPDLVIALGLILRGKTAHADLIGQAITQQLLQSACSSLVPVIHEVLLLDSEEQAFERCVGSALNRGQEAARAGVAMLTTIEEQNRMSRRRMGTRSFGSDPLS